MRKINAFAYAIFGGSDMAYHFNRGGLPDINNDKQYISKVTKNEELDNLKVTVVHTRCHGCENNCLLTVNEFSTGKKFNF